MARSTIPHSLHKLLCTTIPATGQTKHLRWYYMGYRIHSVWKGCIAPNGDREFYYADSPKKSGAIHTVNVQAAPTRHFLSVFHDSMLCKFQNMILKKGRGDIACSVMNDTMRQLKLFQLAKLHGTWDDEKKSVETNPLVIFHQAVQNTAPALGLQQAVHAGAVFHVPSPLPETKKFFITCNWFLEHARSGKPKSLMSERLAKEILLAYNGEGMALKRKQDLHRQVIASRAYIHMRWA